MPRVGANDAHHTLPANDLAVAAHLFYRCLYFHGPLLLRPGPRCYTRTWTTSRGIRSALLSNHTASVPPSPCHLAGCGCSACASCRRYVQIGRASCRERV